ncbi:MAG: hypothetical protein JRJ44_05095 [Deltaproteobacteria bacterium]|nr:hypothetical protein [Deltaproteobacteria bacterium]
MKYLRGATFHNSNFKFHDGAIGNKILVLLNTPTKKESCLLVKTTSQKKNKPSTYGCFLYYKTGIFFLPKKTTFLKEDT